MSSELARRAAERTGIELDRRGRKKMREITGDVVLSAHRMDGQFALTIKSMDQATDVIAYAQEQAGDDPETLKELMGIARNHIRRMTRVQDGLFGRL